MRGRLPRWVVDGRMFAAAFAVSVQVRRARRKHEDLDVLLGSLDAGHSRRRPRRFWGPPARIPVVTGWCFRFADRSCVGQSLTAYALLRRQGESASFVSGVTALVDDASGAMLDGHAWVELAGSPLGERDAVAAVRYREIYRFPVVTSDRSRSSP